jgi:glycolate oxidase
MLSKRATKELKRMFGSRVLFSPEERICYSFDATNVEHIPDCVAFPRSAGEVDRAMTLAVDEKLPVIPRCAGSGFSGGSVACKGGMVLSFEMMHKILKVDTDALTATVQPGVVTESLQKEVSKVGLFYPPDPASLSFSMIGGNIGTNAGGPRGVKYGTTRDYVKSLDVVTPAFGRVPTGEKTCGLDLTPLFVGAEGTLGVLTGAVIRLVKAREATLTVLACFKNMRRAAEATGAVIESGVIPCAAEFIDRPTVACVFGDDTSMKEIAGSNILVMEVDGWKDEVEEQSNRIMSECRRFGAHLVRSARDQKERDEIWTIRRGISPALARIAPNKINPDVCVPRSKLPEYLSFVSNLSRKHSVKIFNFGHAGDGNIHTNILFDRSAPDERKAAEAAHKELFEKTLELGGTISGEHGIGITRRKALRLQIGPEEIRLRKRIKELFDPSNIMNPGKGL